MTTAAWTYLAALERWDRLHAHTVAHAAMDLKGSDDPELQAIGVELRAVHDDMADCLRVARERVADA